MPIGEGYFGDLERLKEILKVTKKTVAEVLHPMFEGEQKTGGVIVRYFLESHRLNNLATPEGQLWLKRTAVDIS